MSHNFSEFSLKNGGLTKKFSCDIMLSQNTHDLLNGAFLTEQLFSVTVKGKKEGVMIYKLLDYAWINFDVKMKVAAVN